MTMRQFGILATSMGLVVAMGVGGTPHDLLWAAEEQSPAAIAAPLNPFGNALEPDLVADPSISEIDGVFYL